MLGKENRMLRDCCQRRVLEMGEVKRQSRQPVPLPVPPPVVFQILVFFC